MKRLGLIGCVAVALAFGALTRPAAAFSAPSNDNFSAATVVTGVPYTDTVSDIAYATAEWNEPNWCGRGLNTVWYEFTASRHGVITASTSASFYYYNTQLAAFQATGPGFDGLSIQQCSTAPMGMVFEVQAGETYYLQVANIGWIVPTSSDWISLSFDYVPPPANDNFADATAIGSLPFSDSQSLVGSTVEPGEPVASCHGTLVNSVWHTFTPATSGSYLVQMGSGNIGDINVFTGTSFDNLTNVACAGGYQNQTAMFNGIAGTIYYVQTGSWDMWATMGTTLQQTPPPVIQYVFPWPNDPSIFDTITLYGWAYDPAGQGISTWAWDFGDGTTATGMDRPTHRWAADGDYTVTLSVATPDGRTASQTTPVTVRTHDVAINWMSTPGKGRVGRISPIEVGISNTRYPETVQVDFYRSTPGGYQLIGSVTQQVPVMKSKKTVMFSYEYTFTNDDLTTGKVSFQAVATIQGARDGFPADNSSTSFPTLVTG